jgi:hypothetical protein
MDAYPRFFCVCVVLCRWWPCDRADHTSKEFYQLAIRFIVQINSDGNRPEWLIRKKGERKKEDEYLYVLGECQIRILKKTNTDSVNNFFKFSHTTDNPYKATLNDLCITRNILGPQLCCTVFCGRDAAPGKWRYTNLNVSLHKSILVTLKLVT